MVKLTSLNCVYILSVTYYYCKIFNLLVSIIKKLFLETFNGPSIATVPQLPYSSAWRGTPATVTYVSTPTDRRAARIPLRMCAHFVESDRASTDGCSHGRLSVEAGTQPQLLLTRCFTGRNLVLTVRSPGDAAMDVDQWVPPWPAFDMGEGSASDACD